MNFLHFVLISFYRDDVNREEDELELGMYKIYFY